MGQNKNLSRDSCGRTKLHKQILFGTPKSVENLFRNIGTENAIKEELCKRDSCGGTPLDYAIYRTNPTIIDIVRRHLNIQNSTLAEKKPKFKVIRSLLLKAIERKDCTPMQFVVTYLIELYNGKTTTNVNSTCKDTIINVLRNALNTSINYEYKHAIEYIMESMQQNETMSRKVLYGNTKKIPMHHAVRSSYIDGFKILFKEQGDLFVCDWRGRNVLHIIVKFGTYHFIKHIMETFGVVLNSNNNDHVYNACKRSTLDIMNKAFEQKGCYTTMNRPFTSVNVPGKRKVCKVPCYVERSTKYRTPIEAALYMRRFNIIVWFSRIPCARGVVMDLLCKTVSNALNSVCISGRETSWYVHDIMELFDTAKKVWNPEKITSHKGMTGTLAKYLNRKCSATLKRITREVQMLMR